MFSCPIINISSKFYDHILKYERHLFYIFLFITLIQLWLTRYVPSLDGPQHLYNATVLSELLKGNEFIASFFAINKIPVGYWSSHFFLALLVTIFPAWLAEKLFLSTYVILMVFSFRYLVRSLNPSKGNFIVFFIFPFVYHSFILMGYYAFSMAAILFFYAFAFYIRNRENFTVKKIILISFLLLLLFFTHALIYVFFLASFVIFYLGTSLHQRIRESSSFSAGKWLNRSLKIAAAALPSIVVWIFYMKAILVNNSSVAGPGESLKELLVYLFRIRQLVGFHHEMEAIAYIPVFIMLVLLFLVISYYFIWDFKGKQLKIIDVLSMKYIWFFISLMFLALYFFAPNKVSAGSLTNRFALYFFLSLIVGLAVQKIPKAFHFISLLVLLFSVVYARHIQYDFYSKLNEKIEAITELSDSIEENSVVDFRLSSNNWVHLHFQKYAVLDKPVVHLRNTQCGGEFPMVWNYDELPRCYAGDRRLNLPGARRVDSTHDSIQIDYITVFMLDMFEKDSTELEWQQILDEDFILLNKSRNGMAAVYKNKEK